MYVMKLIFIERFRTIFQHNCVMGDNGSDFTYEAIKKGDKLPFDSLNMLYFSSIGGQMVTQNIVVVPTYGGFIAEVNKVEVLQCK